jgi:hypothetical protein
MFLRQILRALVFSVAPDPAAPAHKPGRCVPAMKPRLFSGLQVSVLFALLSGPLQATALDLRNAVVVSPAQLSSREKKAVQMLIEEVEKRTHVLLPMMTAWPASNAPVIAVGNGSTLQQLAGPYAKELLAVRKASDPEGYRLCVKRGAASPGVFVVGDDARGVLFGVGGLLRALHMSDGSINLADDLDLTTAPKYPLRGHQLGYRPKTHSYDAWDLPVWEQYIRDLAVFGGNAIQLIPPRSDDDRDSPHFPRPPMQMMTGMSALADAYGLDVWAWYPALDSDYSDPKTIDFALREWAEVFSKLPRLDAVFVPGGDPGRTPPKLLMALLAKQTENLHRYHPKAQMWVSPQGFTQQWWDDFIAIVRDEQPAWLTGVVFGPQVRLDTVKLRALLPTKYQLRHYPDITHNRQCQFPVADWDTAFALTEARECVNPRPRAYANIFRVFQPPSLGFITYSEGCNDDVNKAIWSGLGWDPDRDVTAILRDYGRYFIGDQFADDFAQGLLALEENWRGPALENRAIETTWQKFQAMERQGGPKLRTNWRFQMAMFRAACDSYVQQRLAHEQGLEQTALSLLKEAPENGAIAVLEAAQATLDRARTNRVATDLREQISVLGEALFQSIRMQLSVQRHRAIAPDRGATLDTIDLPLNNRPWLAARFRAIRALPDEASRLAAIREIVNWTDPGPGGFYDDLGDLTRQPHLVRNPDPAADPSNLESAFVGFADQKGRITEPENFDSALRYSWLNHAETLRGTPLRLHYEKLDPNASYRLRVVYGGDSLQKPIRLVANDMIEIHPLMPKPQPIKPVEFVIPSAATAKGELTLSWKGDGALGGNGRGCQVSEVWLIKE